MVGWLTNLQHFIKEVAVNPTPRELPVGLLDPKVRGGVGVGVEGGGRQHSILICIPGCANILLGPNARKGLRGSAEQLTSRACQDAGTYSRCCGVPFDQVELTFVNCRQGHHHQLVL